MKESVRCPARRAGGTPCPGRLVERHDRITGRLDFVCESCERRKAGVCADCDRPVEGTVGRAERCATHKKRRNAAVGAKSRARYPERIRERARTGWQRRVALVRGGRPPMTRSESGKLGSAARAAALTPERRREIARAAGIASGRSRRPTHPPQERAA